jgi:hypothetical protein
VVVDEAENVAIILVDGVKLSGAEISENINGEILTAKQTMNRIRSRVHF